MRENRQFHKAAVMRDSAALIHTDSHRDNVGAKHRDHTSYRAATGTHQIISKDALTWFLLRDPHEITKYKRSHVKDDCIYSYTANQWTVIWFPHNVVHYHF